MCSDVQNRVGTPHFKMCSDVQNRVGTPHMKMCSNVHTRAGTPNIKMFSEFKIERGHHTSKCVRCSKWGGDIAHNNVLRYSIGWGHRT